MDRSSLVQGCRCKKIADRVIRSSSQLRLKEYNRADLRTSDHRPVYAIFDATIREVDHNKKNSIARELLRTVRSEADGSVLDEKIEKVSKRGIPDLVKGMTNGSCCFSVVTDF